MDGKLRFWVWREWESEMLDLLSDLMVNNGEITFVIWFQNYPICVLWYAFLFVALQVHAVEIYISKTLAVKKCAVSYSIVCKLES